MGVCVLNEAADKPNLSQFWRIRVGQVNNVLEEGPDWRHLGNMIWTKNSELMWLTISHEVM